MPTTVGLDLTSISEVRNSIRLFGQRYLQRVYTPRELDQCRADPRYLAARFAAKEATMKALSAADRLPWHSIAVEYDRDRRPTLRLNGSAAELARRRGVTSLEVSLTHEADHAAAVVLAQLDRR